MLTTAELSSRERVNRMFERREQDRVPRYESFWSDTIERWQKEGLDGDGEAVLEKLDADLCYLGWSWPKPFASEALLEEDPQTKLIRDRDGKVVRLWKNRMGTPEHVSFGCDSREQWETVYKPALLESPRSIDADNAAESFAAGQAAQRWCYLAGVEGFEITRALMGDEIALIAMAEDPEWVVDVSRTMTDLMIRDYQAILDIGIRPDGLWTYGDMAYKNGTMCSPAMYRDLIWPDHKRLAGFAHQNGMKFIYHTDGDVNGVIDLYLEAGFDCLQPLEVKAGMDVRDLAPAYGEQLAFFGNIDIMVMATNDLDLIEQEIASKFAAGMATRGYVYHSDHSVPPSVSWPTYQAIIDLVDRYGRYE